LIGRVDVLIGGSLGCGEGDDAGDCNVDISEVEGEEDEVV